MGARENAVTVYLFLTRRLKLFIIITNSNGKEFCIIGEIIKTISREIDVPIVIATTGFNDEQNKKIVEYSEAIPIFKASNMSYVIHLMSKILKNISPILSHMDIEVIEKHHNKKKDAPSGTALLLANSINSANKNKYNYIYDRNSEKNIRKKNEIGFSSIRGGNIVGEHCVLFLGENESIEIKHTAYSREIFAEGAIRAAKFLIHKKNGIYGMDDL